MKLQLILLVAFYISFTEGATGDYKRLGCFKDTIFRAMSERLSANVKSVEECSKLAKARGFSTFGVQAGRECYSKKDAANKYKTWGASANCRNGMGGEWANDVYQFNEGTYVRLGCWEDKFSRALSKNFGIFTEDALVRTCADHTRAEGWSVFGVQAKKECWSAANGESTYTKYGNKSGDPTCGTGTGGNFRNEVYRLPAAKCLKCNGKDSCTKVTCSNTEPYCYKLSADQELGGTTSRVTLGGCASNCTSAGEADLCAGKKNCVAFCCKYDNCNDPSALEPDYPKCYGCSSTKSASDCESNQYEIPCNKNAGAQSYCYTAENNGTYSKGCAKTDYIKCTIDAASMCSGKTGCSKKCCTGFKCNGAIKMAVSGFLIMACVLMKFML